VPVKDGSLVDLVCDLESDASVESVNAAMKTAASGELAGVLQYSEEPLVSTDIIGNPYSSVFDSLVTKTMGPRMVKVLSWYDNEFAYASRMVDVVRFMAGVGI
jgi:glyceraldehyde 3-phosphate dehydrogenase